MKTVDIDNIVSEVRIKLDEIGMNESEMAEALEDNTNMDTVIKSCIPGAYSFVCTNADASMLEGKQGDVSLSINQNMVGEILLPSDFLRLLNVRLSSWISSFSKIVTEYSPEYRMQSNKWVCGNPNCPVVAITHTNEGRKLELYKASSEQDTLTSFLYIPSVNAEDGSLEVSDQVYDAFIYYIAGLTLITFREDAAANNMFSIAKGLLNIE